MDSSDVIIPGVRVGHPAGVIRPRRAVRLSSGHDVAIDVISRPVPSVIGLAVSVLCVIRHVMVVVPCDFGELIAPPLLV